MSSDKYRSFKILSYNKNVAFVKKENKNSNMTDKWKTLICKVLKHVLVRNPIPNYLCRTQNSSSFYSYVFSHIQISKDSYPLRFKQYPINWKELSLIIFFLRNECYLSCSTSANLKNNQRVNYSLTQIPNLQSIMIHSTQSIFLILSYISQ